MAAAEGAETRHHITGVSVVDEIPLAPGVVVPVPKPAPNNPEKK